jgi:hypothetical protein
MRNPILYDPIPAAVRKMILRPLHSPPIHPALAHLAEVERAARRFWPHVAGLDAPDFKKVN